jgi:hypothetical protein
MARVLQLAVDNFRKHMQDNAVPLCFSKKEFKSWKLHETELHTQPVHGFVCRDCTSSYQSKMTAAGRCFNSMIPLEKIID